MKNKRFILGIAGILFAVILGCSVLPNSVLAYEFNSDYNSTYFQNPIPFSYSTDFYTPVYQPALYGNPTLFPNYDFVTYSQQIPQNYSNNPSPIPTAFYYNQYNFANQSQTYSSAPKSISFANSSEYAYSHYSINNNSFFDKVKNYYKKVETSMDKKYDRENSRTVKFLPKNFGQWILCLAIIFACFVVIAFMKKSEKRT